MNTQLLLAAAGCSAILALGGCHKTQPAEAKDQEKSAPQSKSASEPKAASEAKAAPDAKPGDAAQEEDKAEGKDAEKPAGEVTLTPEQIEKIGLQTEEIKAIDYAEETAGYGMVIPHEAIATGVAELATAEATERQSRSALVRTKRLTGTPGAMSADVEEAAAQKAAVDSAALMLAKQRLSSTYGQNPAWAKDKSLLLGLANGSIQLVRVTFPLGAVQGDPPKSLRAARIGTAPGAKGWKLTSPWSAPADATVPGRSFFALMRAKDAGEGERILVWAPIGAPQSGELVPAETAVISDGKYWCYVEEKPGTYVRTQIDTSKPFEDGYFVTTGIQPGDKVVVKGAAQLLAQESNSGPEAD
jgi:hypothetical protein